MRAVEGLMTYHEARRGSEREEWKLALTGEIDFTGRTTPVPKFFFPQGKGAIS